MNYFSATRKWCGWCVTEERGGACPPDMGVYVVTDDPDEEDEPSSSICCLGGCLTGCAFALLLLVILPAGALITFYAGNNNDYGILSVGICMIAIPILAVLTFIFIYMNRRRIRRFRKTKVNGATETTAGKDRKTRYWWRHYRHRQWRWYITSCFCLVVIRRTYMNIHEHTWIFMTIHEYSWTTSNEIPTLPEGFLLAICFLKCFNELKS